MPVLKAHHPSLKHRVTIQSAACQTRQDIARITFCIPFARFPAEISRTHEKKAGESSLRVSMTRPSERGPAQKWNFSREEGLEFPEYLKSKNFDLSYPFCLKSERLLSPWKSGP